MELFFNDLSATYMGVAEGPEEPVELAGREVMDQMLDVCRAAIAQGAERVLRTRESLFALEIMPGYSLVRWLNDAHVEKEKKQLFKALIGKGTFLQALDHDQGCVEFNFDGQEALALGAAYLFGGLAVSLPAHERWHMHEVLLKMMALRDDEELEEEEVLVPHATSLAHLQEHRQWMEKERKPLITSGEELWQRRKALFPALRFCPRVQDQLAACDPAVLQPIYKRLDALNQAFQNAAERDTASALPLTLIGSKVTPETAETLQRYEQEHTFLDPDGEWRLFSWHVRLTPGKWRIFFADDPERQGAIIGHIGEKLPTVRYPK
ncbi:hypothetical protein [Heliophilum fasciatum]|uniref:Uncharacterized protein n=1 Tax=Heliophilum fasciatum TaxID=35700 RepID=A0A4R2RWN9_9FIRM|nr:hypothetical protein [Heliophilum fasciatum]MCW2276739.1 hypothetical protein [Heliophilum fasciatum]TCP68880.1 hypothetical protein EDD73_10141 [Heliophilum fasciatum]